MKHTLTVTIEMTQVIDDDVSSMMSNNTLFKKFAQNQGPLEIIDDEGAGHSEMSPSNQRFNLDSNLEQENTDLLDKVAKLQ